MLLLGAGVAAMTAAATPAPPPPSPLTDTITVTGVRLEELRVADEHCVRDGCRIRDDVIAAVRYADALFYGGRYDDASRVLTRSVARNRDRAAEDPRAMAELYVAQSNVAKHVGDPTRESIALQGSSRVLKQNLPADDQGRMVADLSVGDMFMGRGDARYAQARFTAVAAQAQAAGQVVTARSTELHSAWLLLRRGRVKAARSQLAALAALPGNDMRDLRLAARILEYRIARLVKDQPAMTNLLAAIASEPPTAPLLLWEPPLPSPDEGIHNNSVTGFGSDPATSVALRWADIEFEVTPSGTVKGVEVVSGPGSHDWLTPVLKSIERRLYTPVAATADAPLAIKKERYSLTATFEKPKTSNIPRRMLDARYERLDLTQPPPQLQPAAPGPSPAS